jgi:hypothetical protein
VYDYLEKITGKGRKGKEEGKRKKEEGKEKRRTKRGKTLRIEDGGSRIVNERQGPKSV